MDYTFSFAGTKITFLEYFSAS